jgi:hypothetical protein
VPGEWRRKWGETGISLIPAIRAARFTRFLLREGHPGWNWLTLHGIWKSTAKYNHE